MEYTWERNKIKEKGERKGKGGNEGWVKGKRKKRKWKRKRRRDIEKGVGGGGWKKRCLRLMFGRKYEKWMVRKKNRKETEERMGRLESA